MGLLLQLGLLYWLILFLVRGGLPEYRHTLGWPEYRPHGQDAHATGATSSARPPGECS